MERCGERQGYQQKSSGAAGLNPCSLAVEEPLVERLVLGAAIDLESRPEFTIGAGATTSKAGGRGQGDGRYNNGRGVTIEQEAV